MSIQTGKPAFTVAAAVPVHVAMVRQQHRPHPLHRRRHRTARPHVPATPPGASSTATSSAGCATASAASQSTTPASDCPTAHRIRLHPLRTRRRRRRARPRPRSERLDHPGPRLGWSDRPGRRRRPTPPRDRARARRDLVSGPRTSLSHLQPRDVELAAAAGDPASQQPPSSGSSRTAYNASSLPRRWLTTAACSRPRRTRRRGRAAPADHQGQHVPRRARRGRAAPPWPHPRTDHLPDARHRIPTHTGATAPTPRPARSGRSRTAQRGPLLRRGRPRGGWRGHRHSLLGPVHGLVLRTVMPNPAVPGCHRWPPIRVVGFDLLGGLGGPRPGCSCGHLPLMV
jgi:hypothetical protein